TSRNDRIKHMVTISVKVEDGEVRAMLRGIAERTGNLTPAMRLIGQIIRNSVVKNFMEGGRPQKWKPHAEATIMGGIRKKDFKKKGGLRVAASRRLSKGKVLVDTARLQNSIKSKAFKDRAEIGTKVIYAAIHQFGGKAGRGHKVNVPARPFLMVQGEDWTEIRAALTDHILKGAQ
ncbi:MAG: phage virion morphogenesis protein, partial [Candidatus Subteraquimicrobiales bacterium]|nr:phage virion morphogenesis protein [Candidatus Subteraquimicrobiales bacterium]